MQLILILFLLLLLCVLFLFCVGPLVLMIIANWRLYAKMGRESWESIIPIYNNCILYKIIWDSRWIFMFCGPLIASIIISLLSGITDVLLLGAEIELATKALISVGFSILSYATSIVSCVIGMITTFKMMKRFGKSTIFCVCSIFFPYVCLPIVAFDDSAVFN